MLQIEIQDLVNDEGEARALETVTRMVKAAAAGDFRRHAKAREESLKAFLRDAYAAQGAEADRYVPAIREVAKDPASSMGAQISALVYLGYRDIQASALPAVPGGLRGVPGELSFSTVSALRDLKTTELDLMKIANDATQPRDHQHAAGAVLGKLRKSDALHAAM